MAARRPLAALLAAAALSGGWASAAAAQPVPPAGTNDFGGFRNVLVAGQGEGVNAAELARYLVTGEPPPTFVNQLAMYRDLPYAAAEGLEASDVERFFKPAGFGVPQAEVDEVVSPRPGVTIVRDRAYRVPHVHGVTRSDTMFGAGYAQAQDRMFLMDVLRHSGRGDLSAFVGPGTDDANLKADILQLKRADYTEDELAAMVSEERAARHGAEGRTIRQDILDFTAGVNAWIAEANADPDKLPAEYPALGKRLEPWKPTDTAAAATLVGARFGLGGGKEHLISELYRRVRLRFGPGRSRAVLADLVRRDDPEAPVTIRRRFPFDDPGRPRRRAYALLDTGSYRDRDLVVSDTGGAARAAEEGSAASARRLPLQDGLRLPGRLSNALLVSADRSASGRPLAVMGPQIGYYSPEIFMEMDLHGPGIDVRGGVFPGVAPYILIGRGPDYAWTATSAGTDNVDVFADPLCEPDGSAPTLRSTHYRYKGRCLPMKVQERTLRMETPPSSPTRRSRTVKLRLERTVHGPVQGRATHRGRPVALTWARSTYQNELESAIAFKRLNFGEVTSASSFRSTMAMINFVFNWFYVDDRDIAYLQSGWFPRRAKGTDPSFPTPGDGRHDWRGFDPETFRSNVLPARRLPQATNPRQGYFANWNNKQAPGWRAADDVLYYSSVHRSEILEQPLRALLRGKGELQLHDLVQVMADGATVDLRGRQVWPVIRRVIGDVGRDAEAAALVKLLDDWVAAGAHRRDLDRDNVYEHSAGVALMDRYWQRVAEVMFRPKLGRPLFEQLDAVNDIDDEPAETDPTGDSVEASAYGSGWYGYVDKDLRAVLGQRVRGALSRKYCGAGSLRRCRRLLLVALKDAGAAARRELGADPAAWKVPATCEPDDDGVVHCDQIDFTAAGAVELDPIPFQNRPTFQQVAEPQGHRPR